MIRGDGEALLPPKLPRTCLNIPIDAALQSVPEVPIRDAPQHAHRTSDLEARTRAPNGNYVCEDAAGAGNVGE